MTDLVELQKTVDKLGKLKAMISKLTKQEDALKTVLAASGLKAIDGKNYRATITDITRTTLDSKRVRALLTSSQILACSNTSTSTTVKIVAPIAHSKAQ